MNASTDLIPLEDFIDKHVGPIGTERRNTFETGYDTFKLGVLIKTLRKQKGMSRRISFPSWNEQSVYLTCRTQPQGHPVFHPSAHHQ